jgi:hypothetical protein
MSIPAPSELGRESGIRRIYLAGPMSGIEDFNRPAFHREAARLRSIGHRVDNPAENVGAPGAEWSDYMRIGIRQLIKCDTIALLPGWETSRGAQIEHRLALDLGIRAVPAAEITS